MKIIARIHTGFPEKFGLPRQAGLVDALKGRIVFEPEYRNPDAIRGLEGFSHIWLIWEFSEAKRDTWSPTVRPPRLGGNKRLGVFATRSPFRPNPIAMSCLKLEKVEFDTPEGPVITVSGIDMMDGTPIYDIKPYIPYTDAHPEAEGGFTATVERHFLEVVIPERYASMLKPEEDSAIRGLLAEDPRPAYQSDPDRIYGVSYGRWEIRFRCTDERAEIIELSHRSGS